MRYELVPTNPLDPTLLSYNNVDEIRSFIRIVEDLKANRISDVDENPYIRQFSQKDKPSYLDYNTVRRWDKNISPWEYYYQFVPAKVDKKKRIGARIYEMITIFMVSILILLAISAIFDQLIRR